MQKFALVIILFFIASASLLALASDSDFGNPVETSETETLIIGFKEEIPEWAFERYEVLETNKELNCILVKTRGKEKVFSEGFGLGEVKYVEENKLVHALYVPNDPLWNRQYGPRSINANDTWDYEKGTKSVKIVIVDTGIQYDHPDLAANYVSGGFDWVNNDTEPYDDYGHGTRCAGIAAAVMDNNIGIAGIAQVSLMSEKVLNETGWGSTWNVSRGITHAANNSADVISLSLGGEHSYEMEDACQYAWNKGCSLVAASGNENSSVIYPAAYETVIAVGAIDQNDNRCSFSNWGPELELVAPGINILSCDRSNQYANGTGTSMATPHVAGVAALIKSRYPEFSNEELRERMKNTARDLGAQGKDNYYGYGLVDAYAALGISIFDTEKGTYPSISGVHEGTIKPNQTIIVDTLYTYSCPGTGGHSEYVWVRGNGINESASWNGYGGDWHNISFNKSFTLKEGETYNYSIKTGSYPWIIHATEFNATGGTITCTKFIDANGKVHHDWLPAIGLWAG
jgi:thermitase